MSRFYGMSLVLCVFLLVAGVANSATLTVDPGGGGDATTINGALDLLDYNDGVADVVNILSGTYDEQLTLKGNAGVDSTAFPIADGQTVGIIDAVYTSHTDPLTLQGTDPNNPPIITCEFFIPFPYGFFSDPLVASTDVDTPIVFVCGNDITLQNLEISATNGAPHLRGQGAGIVIEDCLFTVTGMLDDDMLGIGNNGDITKPGSAAKAFNEFTFRNCLFDGKSKRTGDVQSEGMLYMTSYIFPSTVHKPNEDANGFVLWDHCIVRNQNNECIQLVGQDDPVWEDGCPHSGGAPGCQPYCQEKTYGDMFEYFTAVDCYFNELEEDNLFRVRGMAADLTMDRCIFDRVGELNKPNEEIFTLECRHRGWWVNISITNSIFYDLFSVGGIIRCRNGYNSGGNPNMPEPELHIVNNTFYGCTPNDGAEGKSIFDSTFGTGCDPEMLNPIKPWPEANTGWEVCVPVRDPLIYIANNIFDGSANANLFMNNYMSELGFQAHADVVLTNNCVLNVATADTTNAHAEVGTMNFDPAYLNTNVTMPSQPGLGFPGSPFFPTNPNLLDAGDAAAYAASNGGAYDVDGSPREEGTIDIGAQEMGTFSIASSVDNWALYDWDKY